MPTPCGSPLARLSRPRQPSREAAEADRPWLTSEVLRLAISTAVDRREYCKQVFYGACDPMAGPVSPANVAWFNPDFPLGQGNPQLARAKLAELGLRDRTGDGLLDDAARRHAAVYAADSPRRAGVGARGEISCRYIERDRRADGRDAARGRCAGRPAAEGELRRHLRSHRGARHRSRDEPRFLVELGRRAPVESRAYRASGRLGAPDRCS